MKLPKLPKLKQRVIGMHRKGCFAVAHARSGHWPGAWSGVVEEVNVFVPQGRGHLGPWIQISCNDPNCAAKLLVLVCGSSRSSSMSILDFCDRW